MGESISTSEDISIIYPLFILLISGIIFRFDWGQTMLSAVAFGGFLVSWIWSAVIGNRYLYATATPAIPVTSFNQIIKVSLALIFCFITFFMGILFGNTIARVITIP